MKKEDITFQDKLNELRLDISHPNSKGINFIFVEGAKDIIFFRKFFNPDKCKVENIPGGKIKLEECVSDLIKIYPFIIGIRDADFIHLNGGEYLKANVFLTDFHDIEITMLAQDSVLNSLLFEFTNDPKERHLQFRDNMLKAIEMVGYLKWLNDKENLVLKFSSSGFQDLVLFANFEINFNQYLQRVLVKSTNAKIKDKKVINKKISELIKLKPDLMQLTNGHDLLTIFAKYFREKTTRKGFSDEKIVSALRMTFSFEYFKKTNLYDNLNAWSIHHKTELFWS